jgi:predicted PurR-regulated permease PerM
MTEATPPEGTPDELAEERAETMRRATEIAIRLGVLAIVVGWCLQIIAPFVGIVAWGMIIAIASTSPYEFLVRRLGGKRGLAATLLVCLSLAVVVVPAVMLSSTLISGAQHFSTDMADGSIDIPPPPAHVADWPIVGERIFDLWTLATHNLTAALGKLGPQLKAVSAWLLHAAGSAGAGLLQLVASLIIAGIMLSRSANRSESITRLASRLAGPKQGPALAELARATVSSVVQGIVGVALIQAILAGIGFTVAGVPGAGLWALLVLVAAVVQLPVALVVIPPILLVFSDSTTTVAVLFTGWCVFVALIDNFLKPILFGRGVSVPTVVIFVGAIGGMLSMGIIGLFLGAVVLGLGYELLKAWLAGPETASGSA